MTADEIFDSVIALMFSENADKTDFPYYPGMLNIILAETFELNNSHRSGAGKEELKEIPFIRDLNDKVDYEPKLLRMVIPYGVAGLLLAEDDSENADYYKSKYEQAKAENVYAKFAEVREII